MRQWTRRYLDGVSSRWWAVPEDSSGIWDSRPEVGRTVGANTVGACIVAARIAVGIGRGRSR